MQSNSNLCLQQSFFLLRRFHYPIIVSKAVSKVKGETARGALRDCFFGGIAVRCTGTYDIVRRGGVDMIKREEPTNKVVKATEARDQLPQILNSVYRGQG